MPRLPPSLLWAAHRLSPHASLLLPVCRNITSALAELRWIREHVDALPRDALPGEHRIGEYIQGSRKRKGGGRTGALSQRSRLYNMSREGVVSSLCRRRGRGEPLQYILGTQPFGDLEIKCRPGVLIPRPETEAYTVHLAELIRAGRLRALEGHPALSRDPAVAATTPPPPLRILDICTGTGCIALGLASRLGRRGPRPRVRVEARGLDVSVEAVLLARENAASSFPPRSAATAVGPDDAADAPWPPPPTFEVADVFWHDFVLARSMLPLPQAPSSKRSSNSNSNSNSSSSRRGGGGTAALSPPGPLDWDVVTCNPPYVSDAGFARDTARSVRNFEPRAANVPLPRYHHHRHHRHHHARRDGNGYGDEGRPEDVFYGRVLRVAVRLARARVVLLEVADLAQARRVAAEALRLRGQRYWRGVAVQGEEEEEDEDREGPSSSSSSGDGGGSNIRPPQALLGETVSAVEIEIWRDWPDYSEPEPDEVDHVLVGGTRIPVKGSGHGRAVLIQLDYQLTD